MGIMNKTDVMNSVHEAIDYCQCHHDDFSYESLEAFLQERLEQMYVLGMETGVRIYKETMEEIKNGRTV